MTPYKRLDWISVGNGEIQESPNVTLAHDMNIFSESLSYNIHIRLPETKRHHYLYDYKKGLEHIPFLYAKDCSLQY